MADEMAYPHSAQPPRLFGRVGSTYSSASSDRVSRSRTFSSTGLSDVSFAEAPRARHQDQLMSLAVAAGVPVTLPKPVLNRPDQRAVAQYPSDKAGAEDYLMALRPKKFLVGKSSKSFASDELMLALDKAIKDSTSADIVEALLQLAESSGVDINKPGPAFSASKKGQAVPTLDYLFGQAEGLKSFTKWRLFLGRASQRARDNSLAGVLKQRPVNSDKMKALLEWGANPDLCHDEVLDLLSSPDTEDLIESLFLSPFLGGSDFLSRALVQSAALDSVRKISILLLRGADANYNRGEALKIATSQQSYDVALAMLLLSRRAISASIIDEAAGLLVPVVNHRQRAFVKLFLLAGSCGSRTSKIVANCIAEADDEIITMLTETHAFTHSSFPGPTLFHAAVERKNLSLALNVLSLSRVKPLSDYAKTGVHERLVQLYSTSPDEILNIVSELLALDNPSEIASRMLLGACRLSLKSGADVFALVDLLIQQGEAKITFEGGQCLFLAIEAGDIPVIEALISARPAKSILSAAITHSNLVLHDQDPAKFKIWTALINAGAAGTAIDQLLVEVIDESPQALMKVKTLLPAASLDHADGEAILKTIRYQRGDILESCLEVKRPLTALPWIWKETRQIFAITTQPPYSLVYMQRVFRLLHQISSDAAPSDELLVDAVQCKSRDVARALVEQFLRWGASPDHDLGAALVSCVKLLDRGILTMLLAQKPNKTSMRYAFETALSLSTSDGRHGSIEMLIGNGVERALLDAALPRLLKESTYDSATAMLLVNHGARLHRSVAEHLVPPCVALDLQLVDSLITHHSNDNNLLVPLQAVTEAWSDWQTPGGRSLSMVKLLLSYMDQGTWADSLFVNFVDIFNQHATDLFIDHLTSKQVLSYSLRGLLLGNRANMSSEKLSMASYLLQHGAQSDAVDEIYVQAAHFLRHDWVTALDPYLTSSVTRLSAFETLSNKGPTSGRPSANELQVTEFLLRHGLRGPAVDRAFVNASACMDLPGMKRYTDYASPDSFSQALTRLTSSNNFANGPEGQAAVRHLIVNGASDLSVLGTARVAARAGSLGCTKMIIEERSCPGLVEAAFQGLMDADSTLSTPECRSILNNLTIYGLAMEDAQTVAGVAATTNDLALLQLVTQSTDNAELYSIALEAVARSVRGRLLPEGLSFLKYVLEKSTDVSTVCQLAITAAVHQDLPALSLLLDTSPRKELVATTAFAALKLEDAASPTTSTDLLAALKLLLKAGAKGPVVEKAAAQAARISDYDVLDVLLDSPAASAILPAAFRAVARDKSMRLTSDQLSIARVLIDHGVSTEVLAIAATETAKLLDLEALKVLSLSPRFPGVADDALRALFLSEDTWASSEGIRITQFLLEVGVTVKSTETAASKAASTLNIDALRVVLDFDHTGVLVDAALASMTGTGSKWLCSEGLRIAELLVQKTPSVVHIEKAFIQACEGLDNDIAELLHPYITNVTVFNTALAKAVSTGTDWLSQLPLIKRLLESGVEGDTCEMVLLKGASVLHHDCVELLSAKVQRPDVYSQAFAKAVANKGWRQSLDILTILLDRGAYGAPVEEAYISAAGHLDYRAMRTVAEHVDNADVDNQAFTAAGQATSWLSPGHLDIFKFLCSRELLSSTVQPILVRATKALNFPLVEVLSSNANENMATAAFAAITTGECDLDSASAVLILQILLQKGARGESVDRAMVDNATRLQDDFVDMLLPSVDKSNLDCFSEACDMIFVANDHWYQDQRALKILRIMIEKGAQPLSAAPNLVTAASLAATEAVSVLSPVVSSPATYARGFDAFVKSSSLWLKPENFKFLEYLLVHAKSTWEGLHQALIDAVVNVLQGNTTAGILVLLLRFNADINHDGARALRLAVKYGSLEMVQSLLRYRPDPITLTLAMREAVSNDFEEQKVLQLFEMLAGLDSSLDAKPDVNHISGTEMPLLFRCLECYPKSVALNEAILNLGADPAASVTKQMYNDEAANQIPDADQIGLLLFAVAVMASEEVVKLIIQHSDMKSRHDTQIARLHHVTTYSQTNALILSAKLDRHELVAMFLDLGANVSHKDCFDRTALFYAARNGNTTAITSLQKKKPVINDGSMHEAARGLHADAVKMLAEAGHDVNFPSPKHGGRTTLCELCANGTGDAVRLHATLTELHNAKAAPLKTCRGRTALFFAIENPRPFTMVTKLLEVILWQKHSDPSNVFEQGNYSYSATMYIKKGICNQPENVANEVLDVLKDFEVKDRFYAKERMIQPPDACGMPQRIADLDHKKWIRTSRLEEDNEDHELKQRRIEEEMTYRDQLNSKRHLLTLEQKEDMAQQSYRHVDDSHWQGMQNRQREHLQGLRFRDDESSYSKDEMLAMHRLKVDLDEQSRNAQLRYTGLTNKQMLGYLDQEQTLRLEGAQDQQDLRLGGLSKENVLKTEQGLRELELKAQNLDLDRTDMEHRLQHTKDLNSDRILTQNRMSELAHEALQNKNLLEQQSRQDQLASQQRRNQLEHENRSDEIDYQMSSDAQRLRTLNDASQIERESLQDKFNMTEQDRQNQLRHNSISAQQMLDTAYTKGKIDNASLYKKGRIENATLRDRNALQENHLRNEGAIEIAKLRGLGMQQVANLEYVGQQQEYNQLRNDAVKLEGLQNYGQQEILNSAGLGHQQAMNAAQLNALNRQMLQDNVMGAAALGQMESAWNRQRLIDNVREAYAQRQIKRG